MKNLLALCLALVFIAAFAGCAQQADALFQPDSLTVTSGKSTIHPKLCFVFENEYRNGEAVLFADGLGHFSLSAEDIKQADFPTLILAGEITASVTGKDAQLQERVSVFSTDFEQIDMQSSFPQLSDLDPGTYLIVFGLGLDSRCGNEEILNYKISYIECVFKLIVS